MFACTKSEPAGTTDTRAPIAVEYVSGTRLRIHSRPDDSSPVATTYQNGESVSVLSRRDKWVEVRTAGGSGWAHAADLITGAETQKVDDNMTPRFVRIPEPVSEPFTHGEVVLEADVNSDGGVMAVRVLSNTTGSKSLELKNSAALQAARFAPIVRGGKRIPFTYEHRVHY